MKVRLVIAIMALSCVSADALTVGRAYMLDDAEQAACDMQDGCVVVSRRWAAEQIEAEVRRRQGNCMGSARFKPDGST